MFFFIFIYLEPKASKAIHGLRRYYTVYRKIFIGVGVVFLLATLTGVLVVYNNMYGMFFTDQKDKKNLSFFNLSIFKLIVGTWKE